MTTPLDYLNANRHLYVLGENTDATILEHGVEEGEVNPLQSTLWLALAGKGTIESIRSYMDSVGLQENNTIYTWSSTGWIEGKFCIYTFGRYPVVTGPVNRDSMQRVDGISTAGRQGNASVYIPESALVRGVKTATDYSYLRHNAMVELGVKRVVAFWLSVERGG